MKCTTYHLLLAWIYIKKLAFCKYEKCPSMIFAVKMHTQSGMKGTMY